MNTNPVSRRSFIKQAAASLALVNGAVSLAEGAGGFPLGLTVASCGLRMRPHGADEPKTRNALDLLHHCRDLGGAGLQVGVSQWTSQMARQLHEESEANHLFLEGQIRLPSDDADLARFEKELKIGAEAGIKIFRSVALGTRRYETFKTLEEFRIFRERSEKSLRLSEGPLKRLGLQLALENHKDWRVPELLSLMRMFESEQIGVCLDTGNSISLLEDPMEVINALAPFALTTHLKDMAVEEYADGFLLSEVPFGEGYLDMPRIVATIGKAKPGIRFNLEMITRDPLQVPCLKSQYYVTFPDLPAPALAATLRAVRTHPPKQPLPRISGLTANQQVELEERNNARCFAWAKHG